MYRFVIEHGALLASLTLLVGALALGVCLLWRAIVGVRRGSVDGNIDHLYRTYRTLLQLPLVLRRDQEPVAFRLHVVVGIILGIAAVGVAGYIAYLILSSGG